MEREHDNRDRIIKELTEEVASVVWNIDSLRKRAEGDGIKPDEL